MNNFLTEKQVEVLSLRASGLANKEIASRLNISIGAVHQRINSARFALNAKNTTNAVARFILYNSITADRVDASDSQGREQIIEYFDHIASELEIEVFRDALCKEVAGHADYKLLTDGDWSEFVERFMLFINQIQNYRNSKQ